MVWGYAGAERGGIRPHLRDDLGCSANLGDGFGEDGGLLVEKVLSPVAELQDARIPRAQLLGRVGDLVMVQLVELECLAQMGAHRGESRAQVGGQRFTQLGLGEGELVRRRANPLVCADQRLLGATCEIGVLRGEFFLFAFASAPNSSHRSILVSRVPAVAEHPLRAGAVRSGHVRRSPYVA